MTSMVIRDTDPAAPVLDNAAGSLLGVLDSCLIVNNVYTTANDTAWTDRNVESRLEGGTAFNLLPTAAAADRIYIGMPVKFPKTKYKFTTAGVGGTYVWEYWNGTTWATLTVTDGTSGFTVNGTVTWTMPSNWATIGGSASAFNINNVTQFWVRVRATVAPSTIPTIDFLTVGGWTRQFSGTNQASYRQGTPSNGFIFRIDDSVAATTTGTTRAIGYETLTTLAATIATDTATGSFPTNTQQAGGAFWNKGATAGSKPWFVGVSEKLFHYFVSSDAALTSWAGHSFGDIRSYKTTDTFHTIHIAPTAATQASNNNWNLIGLVNALTAGHFMTRSFSQAGTSVTMGKSSDGSKMNTPTSTGSSGLIYPNPVDGGLYLAPLWLHEGTTGIIRGELPGVWSPLHATPLAHLDTFSGTGTLAGRTYVALRQQSGMLFLETSDTWTT